MGVNRLSGICQFLSYFMRHKTVKACMIGGTLIFVIALIEEVLPLDIFTNNIVVAAMLLHMSYESTLVFTGYGIILLGALISVFLMLKEIRSRRKDILRPKKLEMQFIILFFFIISFLIARSFVVLLNADINPTFQLWMKGYRIHHFFFGIGLLVIGGWLGHIYHGNILSLLSAGIYGIGLGLIADEFGLMLTFGDYWADQSYTFFVAISLFLLVTLLFESYKVFTSFSKNSVPQAHQR